MKQLLLTFFLAALLLASCAEHDDGPMSLYPDGVSQELSDSAKGFVLRLALDSSRLVHLRSDSLPIALDSIWTLGNCYLSNLYFEESLNDTVLDLNPIVQIGLNGNDCAMPSFRPDTLLYLPPEKLLSRVKKIRVFDSDGNVDDSIALRFGSFYKDTAEIYMDSTFADAYALPRRTKGLPSVMRNVDSLKERTFYWRPMPSKCNYIVDTCETVPDTAYPVSWSLKDTNLVPIRLACKDSTERYCLLRDWANDTLKLGDVQTRLDTLWYTTWYLISEIPKCGTINKATYGSYGAKKTLTVYQEIFTPKSETECFSEESATLAVLRLDSNRVLSLPDFILSIFETATIGRDTL